MPNQAGRTSFTRFCATADGKSISTGYRDSSAVLDARIGDALFASRNVARGQKDVEPFRRQLARDFQTDVFVRSCDQRDAFGCHEEKVSEQQGRVTGGDLGCVGAMRRVRRLASAATVGVIGAGGAATNDAARWRVYGAS